MRVTILFGVLLAAVSVSLSASAQSVFTVDRLTDIGEGAGVRGDLRYCITNAVDGDTIQFDVTGTINLTSAPPDLTRNIRIEGPGANLLTVRPNTGGVYRIFTVVRDAAVSISSLRIAYGQADFYGGGIYNEGNLTIYSSDITGNIAGGGAGIFNANTGTLTVRNTSISNNRAVWGFGGGIYNGGTLWVSDSLVSGNQAGSPFDSADGRGGGIYNNATLTVSNSTISGNEAVSGFFCTNACEFGSASGGGISNTGTLLVSNSTISGNRAEAPLVNAAEGGMAQYGGSLRMRNSILAGNSAPGAPDFGGHLSSSGYNLIGNTTGGSGFDQTDLLNVNPMLGPLQDNGGPTFTHALLPGSPAIDAGDPDFRGPPDFDQRGEGFPRIVNGVVDIGAFEAGNGNHIQL